MYNTQHTKYKYNTIQNTQKKSLHQKLTELFNSNKANDQIKTAKLRHSLDVLHSTQLVQYLRCLFRVSSNNKIPRTALKRHSRKQKRP